MTDDTPSKQTIPAVFHTTRWTLVLRSGTDAPEGRAALGELCAAYWAPVFRFLRSEGRNEDDSRELAQAFFERVLARGGIGRADPAKGRFRSYLLGALKHFLAERRRNEGRQKRGAGAVVESIDREGTDTFPACKSPMQAPRRATNTSTANGRSP